MGRKKRTPPPAAPDGALKAPADLRARMLASFNAQLDHESEFKRVPAMWRAQRVLDGKDVYLRPPEASVLGVEVPAGGTWVRIDPDGNAYAERSVNTKLSRGYLIDWDL